MSGHGRDGGGPGQLVARVLLHGAYWGTVPEGGVMTLRVGASKKIIGHVAMMLSSYACDGMNCVQMDRSLER